MTVRTVGNCLPVTIYFNGKVTRCRDPSRLKGAKGQQDIIVRRLGHWQLGQLYLPAQGLPSATPALPTHPLWGQGERLAGGRQKTEGNQGVADKTATQTAHSLSKSVRFVKGFASGSLWCRLCLALFRFGCRCLGFARRFACER